MAPSAKSLTLPANPRAVRLAREWAGHALDEIGRPDLVDSAELGVSELVTNAIMHSEPPVTVRLRGTKAHPRIEVADRSLVPPRPFDDFEEGEDLLSTFGRGLALVARHSAGWGSDIDRDGSGKTVWFEPVTEPSETEVDGDLFDLDEAVARRVVDAVPAETVQVTLLGMPVADFHELRGHYNELRRELRLLAMSEPDRYPLAVELTEITLQVEIERRQTTGLDVLAAAEAAASARVDLSYAVPVTAPATMARLGELLEQVNVLYDSEALLAPRPTERLAAVQAWYLGEFTRQGAGEEPRPWTGGYAGRQSAS